MNDRPHVASKWSEKVLIWTIGGLDVPDNALRAWSMKYMEYHDQPHGGCIRRLHTAAWWDEHKTAERHANAEEAQ